jgi:TonB-linked SusC/RagA family outer membrane protein
MLIMPALLLVPAGVQAQPFPVSGIVTSADDGRPLPSVAVSIEGTDISIVTASNGRYTLRAPNGSATLVFSNIGYAEQRVPIENRSVINVSLVAEAIALEGIVAIGYGTQQRRDVTGAVASVSGETITRVATPSVVQALQGKLAGVQITPASGAPGASAIVRIRGVGTLNDASPLYVVDGMLLDDINFLSATDIESIDVLKDASATAIYGSRGANGVIIVTTKQGRIDSPTRFEISAYAGMQEPLRTIDLVSAQEYAQLANELAANSGQPTVPFPDVNAVGAGTDWQDEIFESAPIQGYQLNASGGTDRITYYFSGNVIRQDGVIPRSAFDRLTLRLNNDFQLNENISLGNNLSFAYTQGHNPPGVLSALYRADPTIAPVNPDGSFADMSIRSSAGNPAAVVEFTNNDRKGRRLVGNLFANVAFLGNFNFRTSFGLDYDDTDFRAFSPVFFVSPVQQNTESDLDVRIDKTSTWLWENTLNYNWANEVHRVGALAGITAQSFYNEGLGGSRINIVGESESLWYLNAGDADGQTNFNFASDWKMLSYLFRTNYTLRDRYLLTASMRIDGSSRFGADNRYGYFPSFALGWNVHEESFMDGVAAISLLKLRGSWGQIGNDKIGAYPGIPTVTGNLNAVFGANESLNFGATPVSLANPEVKWERTTQFNFGADASFFAARLNATLDYYQRTTDDILIDVPIPRYIGAQGRPFVNAAEVRNSGIEGSLSWAEQRDRWGFEVGVNGATVNNEVLALAEGRESITGGGLGNETGATTLTVVGQPIGSFYGFMIDGVFQNQAELDAGPRRNNAEQVGDLRFADLSGPNGVPDGIITNEDRTFLGSPIPDFTYGLYGQINVGAFDFAAAFSGQSGNEVFNGKKAVRFGIENFETSYLDRWTGEGTSDWEPRVTNAGHNYLASNRFIEDGSYFKLQNAQLGVRLPASVTSNLPIDGARLYVSGTNLFIISDYSGYTPELVGTGGVLSSGIDFFNGVFPPARTITLGLDLTF